MKKWLLTGTLLMMARAGILGASPEGANSEEGLEALLFMDIPIVTSQGFFERKTTQSLGYATVITSKQIESTPAMKLPDLINYYVPGMNTFIHETAGPMFGVRGVVVDSNAKTLVMLDGQHLNHRQHYGYSNELRVPLIGDIASVEVVNGPGSIVHGSGAISGFINLIPKNGSDFQGLTSTVTGGFEDELLKAETGYGMKYGAEQDLYLYAGVVKANGTSSDKPWDSSKWWFVNESASNAEYNLQADTQTNTFSSPTYKLSASWNSNDFHLNTFLREENAGMNGIGYGPVNPGGASPESHTASFGLRPKWTWKATDTESVDFLGSLLWMEFGNIPDESYSGPRIGSDENHKELKVIGKTTRFESNSLAGGFSCGKREFNSAKQYIGKDVGGNLDGNTGDWEETSLFAEDTLDMSESFSASAGIRYDNVSYGAVTSLNNYQIPDTDNTSMRAGLNYAFDQDTTAKISYSEGFRYLDMHYLTWDSVVNGILVRNGFPGLDPLVPETMSSTEFNFSKMLPDLKMKFDVNLFYNTYSDMLTWQNFSVDNPAGVSAAGVRSVLATQGWMGAHINMKGDFSSEGVEFIGDWQPVNRIVFRGSYSYSRPTSVSDQAASSSPLFTDDKKEWIRFPNHLLKGVLTYGAPKEPLHLSLTTLYESGTSIEDSRETIAPVYGDDRIILDTAAEYAFTENFSMKLTIKNLLAAEETEKTFKFRPFMGAMGQELRYIYLSATLKLG